MNTNELPLYQRVAEFLYSIGWRPDCDAQHTLLRDALPDLQRLLGPQAQDGGSAFPVAYDVPPDEGYERAVAVNTGITVRDYMAAKAISAVYTEACKEFARNGWPVDWRKGVALDAYEIADAMLKARKS